MRRQVLVLSLTVCPVVQAQEAMPIRASVDRVVIRMQEATQSEDKAKVEDRVLSFPKDPGFWNPVNIAFGVGMVATSIPDIAATFPFESYRYRKITPAGDVEIRRERLHEGNPLYRLFSKGGIVPHTIAQEGAIGTVWVLSHRLRISPHKSHRVMGWVAPPLVMIGQSYAAHAGRNTRERFYRLKAERMAQGLIVP